jgi:hypothetical protein
MQHAQIPTAQLHANITPWKYRRCVWGVGAQKSAILYKDEGSAVCSKEVFKQHIHTFLYATSNILCIT